MTDKLEKSSDNEMTFFEHVAALRPHLLRGGLALFVIMIAAFLCKRFIIDVLLMGPQSPDFPTNRILCQISHRLLGDATLCINSIKLNMINTALGGQFNLHMQVSMVTGVVLAVPYLLWELWRFVAPALGFLISAYLLGSRKLFGAQAGLILHGVFQIGRASCRERV